MNACRFVTGYYPGHMLEARKASVWRNRYDISSDGQFVVSWDGALWRNGGTFDLDGAHYDVRGNVWGSQYAMLDRNGGPVATANRVGRKNWTVQVGDRAYTFRRASMWRQEEELWVDGQRVGSVRRISAWRSDAVADLPVLTLPAQIFVFAVVLTMWDSVAASGG